MNLSNITYRSVLFHHLGTGNRPPNTHGVQLRPKDGIINRIY